VNRNIIVDLGRGEGIVPMREQVRREHWKVGERIRVLILNVEKGPRGPEILLSRAHPDFVARVFEQEVPEIYEKTVEVMSVVREPGLRSKVVVKSLNPKVDPIGACVGVKGSRVRPIINELQGERIDLVAYSDDPASYISASLAPAKPLAVHILDADNKKAEALVPDDALSLAIGKNGQNVRLACKLTGWDISIVSESQRKKETQANALAVREMFLKLEGVGPRIAEILIKGGMDSVLKISKSKVEDLTVYSGIGDKVAEKVVESAVEYIKNPPPPPESDSETPAEEDKAEAKEIKAEAKEEKAETKEEKAETKEEKAETKEEKAETKEEKAETKEEKAETKEEKAVDKRKKAKVKPVENLSAPAEPPSEDKPEKKAKAPKEKATASKKDK